jgi:hypothetical protein
MAKPTLDSLLQILNRCRTYSGDPVNSRGSSAAEIQAASLKTAMEFPPDIRDWLGKVDNVEIPGIVLYGTNEIAKTVAISQEYKSASFLPIGGDSCGNDYVAALAKNPKDPPIVFVEGILGRTKACYIAASSFNLFIKFALERSMSPDDYGWPGDEKFVLKQDPSIASFGYPLPWEA